MSDAALFQDEWLLPAVKGLGVPDDVVERLRKAGEPCLSHALLRQNLCAWPQLAEAVTRQFKLPCLDLSVKDVEKTALSRLSEPLCQELRLIPLRLTNTAISVAMAFPLDGAAKEHIRQMTAREVEAFYALPERIEALVAECYSDDMRMVDLIERLDVEGSLEVLDAGGQVDRSLEAAGTMERFVNDLVTKAVSLDASEIHLEHGKNASEVLFVLDGMTRTILALPKPLAEGPVATRLKAMAGLDISENVRPQEGRVRLRAAGRDVGLRVFTRPGPAGQRIAIRILDERIAAVPFDRLGFRPPMIAKLEALLAGPPGALLVTGPPSSGKTTLLYALLNTLKAGDARLASVEDPVEFKLSGVAQTQVDVKSGLSYATALRAALRGNPQAILVGEIRDAETAGVLFQAAAHRRILSAVHTEDAFSALARLADMALPMDRVAAGVRAVLSQRLIRRLCPTCRRPVESTDVDPAVAAALKAQDLPPAMARVSGCEDCNFTGYRGRLALLELLTPSDELRDLIRAGAAEGDLRRAAAAGRCLDGFAADALGHLAAGDTTWHEVEPFVDLTAFRAALPAAPPAPASPGRKVLVTDDDPLMRSVVRKTLETQGHMVEEAGDGFQALSRVAQKVPDLLVLDVDMPGINGFGVLKMIRKRMALGKLPIIMLTGREDDASQEQAIALGADDYVHKPVKPGILLARIAAVFRRASA